MPSPRAIAEQKNSSMNFDPSVETSYDPVAGAPKKDSSAQGTENYGNGLTSLPPDPPAPVKNLR